MTGDPNAPVSLVTVCASASLFVQCTVVPALTVTVWGPKAKLSILTALAATGWLAVDGGADIVIPLMLGSAVDSADGVPVFPGKPAGFDPLTGLIVELAEMAAGLPQAASSMAPATAVAARRQWHLPRGKWIMIEFLPF
jgi:hypothetical protein